MDRTEVKLNSLSNADWAGTQHQHLFAPAGLLRLVKTAEAGVIVGGLGCKLSRTGIHHLINRADIIVVAQLFDFFLGNACKPCYDIVRILNSLGLSQKFHGQLLFSGSHCLQGIFHLHQDSQLVNEPEINPGDVMDMLIGESAAQCLCNSPDAHIIHPG